MTESLVISVSAEQIRTLDMAPLQELRQLGSCGCWSWKTALRCNWSGPALMTIRAN